MKLSASLYAGDPLRLADEVTAVAPWIDSLHVDIMDGHFAPAFGCNEPLVRALVRFSPVPVDVHLMVTDPALWAPRFAGLGVRLIAFHGEALVAPAAVAAAVRAEGARAYLAVRPSLPVADAAMHLPAMDGALMLTAPAGGGDFDPRAFERLTQLPTGTSIIVDGRIDVGHFPHLKAMGVGTAVIGRSLFSRRGDPGALSTLYALAKQTP